MSNPQKLRQRRRLRRVDNIVSVLDTALKRQASSTPVSATKTIASQPAALPLEGHHNEGQATPQELSVTAEGRRLLAAQADAKLDSKRLGRGPKRGDLVAGTVDRPRTTLNAVAKEQGTIRLLERWKAEMPTEAEMLPRDKYTMFDRKAKGYRKGVHKLPKWTRMSQRLNPPGF